MGNRENKTASDRAKFVRLAEGKRVASNRPCVVEVDVDPEAPPSAPEKIHG